MRRIVVFLAIAVGLVVGSKVVHVARVADGRSADVVTVIRSTVDDLADASPERLPDSLRGVVHQVGPAGTGEPKSITGELSFNGSPAVPVDVRR